MNLTSQYIANSKSSDVYTKSLATYKSICTTSARLRMSDDRYVLNSVKRQTYFQVGGIGFNMLYCPSGKFMMGSNNSDDKNPKRPMAIESPFLLCETEVTQELFHLIMGYNPSEFQGNEYPDSNQRPVELVSWYDALVFCNNLSTKLRRRPYYNVSNLRYFNENLKTNIKFANVTINPQSNGFRLPLEKEWEYAAKAGTNNQWAGTNDEDELDEVAWFDENSEKTHPVKCKNPNEWGFYDMSGNVLEWCYDLYDSNLTYRVIHGGGWRSRSSLLRSAYCDPTLPNTRTDDLGFRVASSLVK